MKNKGLLMIVLLLAFCFVLTGYAMTEGSTERLEIDADKVENVMYLSIESEVGTLTMDLTEDIDRIVKEVNTLQLKSAAFKISDDDISDMTCLMLGSLRGNSQTMWGNMGEPKPLSFLNFLPNSVYNNCYFPSLVESQGLYRRG